MKKTLALVLAALMLVCLLASCGDSETAADTQVIKLGTTAYSITVDASYKTGEVTEDDVAESQVAYYLSDSIKVDFDVYQWAREEGETLADAANEEAAEFEATAAEATFNGITVMFYNATEESEGAQYQTVTYIMEDGDNFAELVFWLDGDNASATVTSIMETLAK